MLHTYNLTANVPTKCQIPTPYSFQDIALTRLKYYFNKMAQT